MSYLARISDRVAGPREPARAVMPKGLAHAKTPTVARSGAADAEANEELRPPEEGVGEELSRLGPKDAEEEEQLVALRRQDAEEQEDMLAPLRRQAEEEEEEAPIQAVRRQAEEEEAPIQAVRRQAEEEEAPIQTLRRQAAEEEDEAAVQPIRTIARQEEIPLEDTGQTVPPPPQESLDPDAGPVSQELAGEEAPPELQALHRDVLSMPAPPPPPAAAVPETSLANRPLPETATHVPAFPPPRPEGIETPHVATQPLGSESRRPQVIIDQVDVLIHETASSPDRSASPRSRDRAMRARYLRRL